MSKQRKQKFPVSMSDMEAATFGAESLGICLACGEQTDGCEPDAREYECPACGEHCVYGLPEALLMDAIVLVGDEGDESQ